MRARFRALLRLFEILGSSGRGASLGAGFAFGSSATLSVSAGACARGGCVMRGSQNLSRGLPSLINSAATKSRCMIKGGAG